ncbi:MAG: FapA family protein [bacterium]
MLTLSKSVMRNDTYSVEISRDHLSATLKLNPVETPSVEDVITTLNTLKVIQGVKTVSEIAAFLKEPARHGFEYIVAEGNPFTIGAIGAIEFKVDFHPGCASGFGENFTPWNGSLALPDAPTVVTKGEALAERKLPEKGASGITVFGETIQGEWGMDAGIRNGANVGLSDDDTKFIALTDGVPVLREDILSVLPLLTIDGDLYPEQGKIKHDGIVLVKGNVYDRSSITATGDVIVNGSIHNSSVRAAGNIVCGGDIIGGGHRTITAGGFIIANNINNASVESQKDIVAEEQIIRSSVCANGRVATKKIAGGTIIARESIAAECIENEGAQSADLMAGFHYKIQKAYKSSIDELRAVQKELAAFQREYEDASKRSKQITPLMENLKEKIISRIDRIKKIQDDIPTIRKLRTFNPMSLVEAKTAIASCTQISLGDFNYSVKNRIGKTVFKWNAMGKKPQIINNDNNTGGPESQILSQNTVLIIDDSKEIRSLLRFICESMDLTVIGEAEDGREGVEKFASLCPSLVTCDISMVNMDGIAALKEIRALSNNAKVIMISAIKDKEKVMECVVSGAFDYIVKPFTPNKVKTVLKTAFLT